MNYYDNYTIPSVTVATIVEGQTVATMVKGLATGSWMRVPTTTAEVKAETTSILYDYKYRPIRTYTANYLGGYTSTDSKLDTFSGQLQYTVQKHKRTGNDAELTVKEAFTYSPQKRLLTHTHQINGGAEQLLADNTYDELGKLTSKKVGNTSAAPLQKVDYSYNIRGWMTAINSIANLNVGTDPADLFSFKLNYNTVDGNVNAANKLYNGNIAETFWSTATDGGFVRNYGYKYDNLNRLKDATYQKSGQVTGMYNENLSYDKNGNIMNLSRYGDRDEQYLPIQIDNLGYTYATNSNKLMSVVDNSNNTSGFKDGITTGDDYVYDANGNRVVDENGFYKASELKSLGSILPDYNMGFRNTLRYKSLSLSFLIDIQQGGKYFSTTHMWGMYSGMLEETALGGNREAGVILDGVKEDGTRNDILLDAPTWGSTYYNTVDAQNVFDASYIKLRDITIGYDLPKSIIGNKIQGIRISAFARNLFAWNLANKGIDPENTSYGSGNIQGLEGGSLPSTRTYGINVNFKF